MLGKLSTSCSCVCLCFWLVHLMLELILSIVFSFYCLLQYARFQVLDLKFNFCQVCHTITNINDFVTSLSFTIFFPSTCMQDVIRQIREKMISEIRSKTLF